MYITLLLDSFTNNKYNNDIPIHTARNYRNVCPTS